MKKTLPLFALVPALLLAACSHKPSDPRVEFATIGFTLKLPDGMQQALEAAMPGFHRITPDKFRSDVAQQSALGSGRIEPLFATLGDFDGDGTKDVIVEGTVPGDRGLHVVAIMNGAKPRAFQVTAYPVFDADAVGTYLSAAPNGQKHAFEVVNYPDASYLYTYKAGGFVGSKIGS